MSICSPPASLTSPSDHTSPLFAALGALVHTIIVPNPSHTFTDNRQRVLDASDIVHLIGQHLTLTPKGREFRCRCPFHDDHNPSMCVVPAKQIYHCFVCSAGGNAIDFVMKFHSMAFRDALSFLAQRAGIPLDLRPASSPTSSDSTSREELLHANSFAHSAFRLLLAHPQHGAAARELIRKRAISPEMVESFQLGAAPDRWDGLLKLLESKGLPLLPSADAGLLKRRDPDSPSGPGYYDAFRNRLVFPIHDQIGRVIAFGARKIRDEDEPKYLNSPESKVFDKGATLFALHQASRSIQNQRHAIITEGYIDAIACHQAGFTNTVATLGTALTHKHAVILERLCSSVTLLFDGDDAGQRAADRALEVFFTRTIDVRIASIPEGADPDDLLKQPDGPDRFRHLLASARDFLQYRFDRLQASLDQRGHAQGSVARSAAVETEVARLVDLGLFKLHPIRRDVVLQNLAHIAGVGPASILATLKAHSRTSTSRRPANSSHFSHSQPQEQPPPPSGSDSVRKPPLEAAIESAFGCLLLDPILAETSPDDAREILDSLAYRSPLLKKAAEIVSAQISLGQAPSHSLLLLSLEEDDARSAVTALITSLDHITEGDHNAVARNWSESLRRIRERLAFDSDPQTTPASPHLESPIDQPSRQPTNDQTQPQTPAPHNPAFASIERLRRNHKLLGGNPLAHPKPVVLSP